MTTEQIHLAIFQLGFLVGRYSQEQMPIHLEQTFTVLKSIGIEINEGDPSVKLNEEISKFLTRLDPQTNTPKENPDDAYERAMSIL